MPTNGLGIGANPTTAQRPAGVDGSLASNTGVADFNTIVYDAFPLTFDQSVDATGFDASVPDPEQNPTLADIVAGNEWRLRRIVGKFFCYVESDEIDSPAVQGTNQVVGLGFLVCKTYDDGAPLTDFTEVNPLAQNSMDDPWIWRRTWVLSPHGPAAFNVTDDLRNNIAWSGFPKNTAGYGSAVDGPHIDQKTARRIHRGERLFAVVATRQWRLDPIGAGPETVIRYHLDYRLLGSVVRGSAGNRRNASR